MLDPKNIKIDKKEKTAIIFINPKIFPLEVIYSASYVFIDKAYMIIDGDPEDKIEVFIKIKDKNLDIQDIVMEFNNELINYSVYIVQAARTSEIRKAIVSRALMTNTIDDSEEEYKDDQEDSEDNQDEVEFIEDPLGIAKPWTPDKVFGLEKPEINED